MKMKTAFYIKREKHYFLLKLFAHLHSIFFRPNKKEKFNKILIVLNSLIIIKKKKKNDTIKLIKIKNKITPATSKLL